MAKKFTFHKGTKQQSSCQSCCCSAEGIESVSAPTCGCRTEEQQVVEEAATVASCDCCHDDKSLSQKKIATVEGCQCCSALAGVQPNSKPDCSSVDGTNMVTNNYDVEGLDCGDCAAKLEKGLKKIKGVVNAQVNFASAKNENYV
jgi:Cd2+/Zn2+-exporting ATPase